MEKQLPLESLSNASEKSGLPPGSLVHVGEVHDAECQVILISYNSSIYQERIIVSIDELQNYRDSDTVTWVNIDGLQDVSIVAAIGRLFDIHPLVLEDILNTHQRPKLEEYDDYIYFVLKGIILENNHPFVIEQEQISILLLENFIFTFKEKKGPVFDPIISRLKNKQSRIRTHHADYLAYVIVDTIVDEYFSLEDAIDEIIEPLEYELLSDPRSETLAVLLNIKRELILIKRTVAPLRELLIAIQHSNSPLIQNQTLPYFTDVLDHAIRVTDALDTHRDILSSLHDIYLTSISNKLNETMKVLTVFASIFIPLTFITGVYGMNFEYMPELQWKWAYPTLWAIFIALLIGLLTVFKRKKWI